MLEREAGMIMLVGSAGESNQAGLIGETTANPLLLMSQRNPTSRSDDYSSAHGPAPHLVSAHGPAPHRSVIRTHKKPDDPHRYY